MDRREERAALAGGQDNAILTAENALAHVNEAAAIEAASPPTTILLAPSGVVEELAEAVRKRIAGEARFAEAYEGLKDALAAYDAAPKATDAKPLRVAVHIKIDQNGKRVASAILTEHDRLFERPALVGDTRHVVTIPQPDVEGLLRVMREAVKDLHCGHLAEAANRLIDAISGQVNP